MAIIITIEECYGDRKTTTLCARTDDLDVAIERAIRKGYGAGNSLNGQPVEAVVEIEPTSRAVREWLGY